MFLTESASRMSCRDSYAAAVVEAQWNWDQDGLPSTIHRGARLIARFEDGVLKPLVHL